MGAPGWVTRYPLGVIVVAPGAGLILWLELAGRLLPEGLWQLALGLPAGVALLTLSTIVTGRRGLSFSLKQVAASVSALFRSPPSLRRSLWLTLSATGEELLFRLLGLWWLGPGPLGVAVTSAVFAATHVIVARPGRRWITIVDTAICGAALAGLYLWSGGLLVAVIAHVIRNLSLEALRLALVERKRRAEASSESSEVS